GQVLIDLPNTSLRREDPRPRAGSPLIVIPTTTSMSSWSEPSRCGLAGGGACGTIGATANLDSSCARRLCDTAGRDEETGFQVKQRNRSRKQERKITALKPLDNKSPIQGLGDRDHGLPRRLRRSRGKLKTILTDSGNRICA